jgi:hypothetical protein
MARHWENKSVHPYYRCCTSADRPSHPHIGFHVRAHAVDALALHLLAKALTDPEEILKLASAAEGQWPEANADAQLAASALAAYHKRIAEITAEHDKLRAALVTLRGTTGTDSIVAGIEARLTQLDHDREEAEHDYEHAAPGRNHAQARADFLRQMFTERELIIDSEAGILDFIGDPVLSIGNQGIRRTADGGMESYTTLTLPQAATLLGVSVDELETMGLPIRRGGPITYKVADGGYDTDVALDAVETVYVVECLLAKMPRDRIRKLLHDLDTVVKVTRGRTRAEIDAGVKKPPLAERVYLELLGTVQVRTDVTKLKTSSYGCLCSPGPSPGAISTRITETPAPP